MGTFTSHFAKWIWVEAGYPDCVQVGWFRRTLEWTKASQRIQLHLSADTRYRAWWNGRLLGRGPAAGDFNHWTYETYEIDLKPGENCLAVEVLFQGQLEALKYLSRRPALIVWTEASTIGPVICSDASWRCLLSKAHDPEPPTTQSILPSYTALGAMEVVDGRRLPEGWQLPDFDDGHWPAAVELPQVPRYAHSAPQPVEAEEGWRLVPSTLPALSEIPQSWDKLVEVGRIIKPREEAWTDGLRQPEPGTQGSCSAKQAEAGLIHVFSAGEAPEYLILDVGEMTTAFVTIELETESGGQLLLRYAEALSQELVKASRAADSGGDAEGFFDSYRLRPGVQCYEPFFWRPFRFLKLVVSGHRAPVKLRRVDLRRCVYPGKVRAAFRSSSKLLDDILQVSWRTAELCAHDTHDDCPYYEQLPYAGDLRLHGPIGAMMTGDERLLERSIRMYAWSQQPDGMILTRYPAREPQIIPPFALIWIQLVEEFYQMSGRADFVRDLFPAVRGILDWMARQHCPERILVQPFPHWNFTDWSIPEIDSETRAGNRASLMMFYIGALQSAARLGEVVGATGLAEDWSRLDGILKSSCRTALWAPEEKLLRDDVKGPVEAVHQTILALCYGVLKPADEAPALRAVLARKDLYGPTVPFSFYLFRAASRIGAYELVWPRLEAWAGMLASGTTTWFERPEPSRSDCHAWSSWILRDFFTELLGIRPLQPGYTEVLVRPQLVDGLDHASGSLPTPAGDVHVRWVREETSFVEFEIDLPPACRSGRLEIGGQKAKLQAGLNSIRVALA